MESHVVDVMKKALVVMVATLTLGCESRNQASDPGAGSELEERAPVGPAESEDASVHSDTTTSGGMNRPNPYDTIK